jgi:inhibitor of KinA sporulation pathway (predicted exonuclease)
MKRPTTWAVSIGKLFFTIVVPQEHWVKQWVAGGADSIVDAAKRLISNISPQVRKATVLDGNYRRASAVHTAFHQCCTSFHIEGPARNLQVGSAEFELFDQVAATLLEHMAQVLNKLLINSA